MNELKKLPVVADILPLLSEIADLKQEHFLVLTFNSSGRLIAKRTVFIGTINATLAHPREIFAPALTGYHRDSSVNV